VHHQVCGRHSAVRQEVAGLGAPCPFPTTPLVREPCTPTSAAGAGHARSTHLGVREVIARGRDADVDLAGQVGELRVAPALVGDHVLDVL